MHIVPPVDVSSDAQRVWLTLSLGARTFNELAAAIAYKAGRAGESPPATEDEWDNRTRAALAELQLLEMVEPAPAIPGGSEDERQRRYRHTPAVSPTGRHMTGPNMQHGAPTYRTQAVPLRPPVPNLLPQVDWKALEERLLASAASASSTPAKRRGRG